MMAEIAHAAEDSLPSVNDDRFTRIVKLAAAYGFPGVVMMVWLFSAYIPDQSARREADKQNRDTMSELTRSYTVLVEQNRQSGQAIEKLGHVMDEQTMIMRATRDDQVKYWEEYNRGKAKQ